MLHEYPRLYDYKNRSYDWFSETVEIPVNIKNSLSHTRQISGNTYTPDAIYQNNHCYLETTHVAERSQRGMFTAAMGLPLLLAVIFNLYFLIFIISGIDSKSTFLNYVLALMIFAGAIILTLLLLFMHNSKDWFTYRHGAIRFNHKTRQVHVFYSSKLGGPRSYNWDDALLSCEETKIGNHVLFIVAADPEKRRCYDSFSVGDDIHDKEDCLAWCEYVRRYMEEGPDSVPDPEWCLTDKLSLKESFLRWFRLRELSRADKNGENIHPALIRMLLLSPVLAFFSLGHYLSMLTSKRVRWPDDIKKACGEE